MSHPATIAFYDTHADSVAQKLLLAAPTDEYARFLALIPAGAHICDAGCGIGRDSKYFIEHGYTVTAFDGSAELAQRASQYIGQPVLHLLFEELTFHEQFNAIWASATLLHIPAASLPDVLQRLENALKPGGILYASFVYGHGETLRGPGLLFNDQDEQAIREVLSASSLTIIQTWQSADAPPARDDRVWINILVKKSKVESQKSNATP
jgi:2-polyprenyl-3-methyl-5-hydroxy-6-metoxy-1,4-benzoquinol methylase